MFSMVYPTIWPMQLRWPSFYQMRYGYILFGGNIMYVFVYTNLIQFEF